MKYPLIVDALKTKKGQKLYELLSKGFDRGLELSSTEVKNAIQGHMPCYLGSEDHIARMVWIVMNEK